MERESFIGFNVSDKVKKQIEKLVKLGRYENRSHFIREAVDAKLLQEETK